MWIRKEYLVVIMLLSALSGTSVIAQSALGKNVPRIYSDTDVHLRPGDVVKLSVWREPDMSGEFIVDKRGEVVFPKLGLRRVTDVPADSVRSLLIREYQQYLQNPSITILFLWRIRVVGPVARPGLYSVDPTTTVTDAIAIAGGITPLGRSDRVDLIRDGVRTTISFDKPTQQLDRPVRSGDEIVVSQRGWLARNPTIIPVVVSGLVSIISVLSR